PAKGRIDMLDHGIDFAAIGDIAAHADRIHGAHVIELLRRALRRLRLDIRNNHRRAFAAEALADPIANPARSAGNDDDLIAHEKAASEVIQHFPPRLISVAKALSKLQETGL